MLLYVFGAPKTLRAEKEIIPQVLKELVIVLTPGGAIGFALSLFALLRRRNQFPAESSIVSVITFEAISLVPAYSMRLTLRQ